MQALARVRGAELGDLLLYPNHRRPVSILSFCSALELSASALKAAIFPACFAGFRGVRLNPGGGLELICAFFILKRAAPLACVICFCP